MKIKPEIRSFAARRKPLSNIHAARWAAREVSRLERFCRGIAVAGSIRRKCPFCGDVDLVALPKQGGRERLILHAVSDAKVLSRGSQNISYVPPHGFPVQLFIARLFEADLFEEGPESNWGTLLLCRTGSKRF